MNRKLLYGMILVATWLMALNQTKAHDFKMAIYELGESNGKLSLTIKFDREDLSKSLLNEFGPSTDSWQKQVMDYVRKHFYLQFNGDYALIQFSEINTQDEYVMIEASLEGIDSSARSINVFSTCLINEIDGHHNLIRSNLFGQERYFRLSSNRYKTVIEY